MVESSVPHLASLPVALVRTSPVVKYHAYDVSCAISSTPFPQPLYYFSSLIILDHIFAVIFSLPFLHPISSPIHLSPERLSFKKKNKNKKTKKKSTVDPWTTWFNHAALLTWGFCSIVNTTWFMVGWICRYRTSNMEGPWIRQANYKLYSDFWLQGRLVPLVVQRLTVHS